MVDPRRPVTGLLLFAGAALLVAASACTSTVPGSAAPGVRVEQRGPAGAVPAGLEQFYGQPLSWGDCKPYATTGDSRTAFGRSGIECANLTVPLDYTKPTGRSIKLGLLRGKATDQGQRVGSLVINPGGPGGSGMTAAAGLISQTRGSELGRRFDLVGFDPRGVGASEPQLRCLSNAERDAQRLEDDTDTSPAGIAKVEKENKDYADKCASAVGADVLANVGTREVAKDMDVLRSALGDAKLSYLGYSYGTRIGTEYAEAFPGSVRALVLDGAVDPTQSAMDEVVSQAAGFQKAFDVFSAWCAQRKDCALGSYPAKATAAFRDLVLPLINRPVTVGDRKLSYSDATTAAIQALYSDQLWEPLNTGLNELRNGKGGTLMALADNYFDRDNKGQYSTITDVFNAVHCLDDQRVTDKNALLETQRRYQQAAPFLDDGQPPGAALDSCAFWPVPPTEAPHTPNADGVPPVLVVSTTNDPATPYQAGVNLANALRGGLLTFEGTQHTAFLQGNKCVDDAGTKYLVSLQLPPAGTRCK
ncbi:alpha/beta hydrolase [Solihabitans fulvus]|uniref:alpha/beta hydrolase n=1 Tax=Solihabitans fulvus TaxID=1892852 RepID=UPI003F67B8E2